METHNEPRRRLSARLLACALLIASAFLTSIPAASAVESASDGPRVVGYLPNWSYGAYETLDFTALTHLNIAFCNPDAAGNISHGLPGDETLRAIVKKAHQNDVKVLASLGGWRGHAHYAELISAKNRDAFNEKLLAFVQKFSLDGIDVDIEGDAPANYWPSFEGWALSLKAMCDSNGLLLTKSVSTWYSDKISDAALAVFDFVNIMAYDGDHANHSPYTLAETMLNHYEKVRGLRKDKLVLGVPFYGFQNDRAVSYKNLLSQYPDAWSTDFVGNANHNGISTIQKKCALAKEYGGIMIWEVSMDAPGERSLLATIKKALGD